MDGGIVDQLLDAAEPGSARIDWERVEAWLGTALPADYRAIADRFGSLFVGDWLWVHAPVRLEGYQTFDRELAGIRSEARAACDERGLDAPVFHPRRGGLLPFGSSRGRELLFWDTSAAAPDAWPVVVLTGEGWIRSGLSLTLFLAAMVTTGVGQGDVTFGPLPAVAERAYRGRPASHWTPPDRASRHDPRRKALKTGSGVSALQVLVPPPAACKPVVVRHERPADYRTLLATYGAGTWRDWLRIWHPDDVESAAGQQLLAACEGMRDDDFLPFADSIDGDLLGWVREGPVDRWPIAWVPRHEDAGRAVPMTVTQALLHWLRGFDAPVFAGADPDVDLVDQATFVPFARG